MGWYQRKRSEDRALTVANVPAVMLAGTLSGEAITPTAALLVADCYSCVRALSDTAGSLPLHVFRRASDGSRERYFGAANDLLNQPSTWQRQGDLIGQTVAQLNCYGNCYWGKYRDSDDRVAQIGCLNPSRVVPEIRDGEPVYGYSDIQGRTVVLGPRDVTHIKLGCSMDGLVGLSPVRQCAEALGLSHALAGMASRTVLNDAAPRGVLKIGQRATPLAGGADGESTVESIARAWKGRHKGEPGRLAVVAGDVEFVPVSMSLAEAEFLAQREFSTAEIARIFRVPPWIVGAKSGDSLTYATVSEQAKAFVTFSLRPILTQIEQAITADPDLCPGPRLVCEFLLDELLRGDASQRSEVYERGLRAGYLTIDEVRRFENLPPLQVTETARGEAPPEPVEADAARPHAA